MSPRVRAALDALRTLEYTPRALLRDLLVSDDEFLAPERALLVAARTEFISLLLRDPTTPKVHNALGVLEPLDYSPLPFFRDLLRSNDALIGRFTIVASG
ncbi:hypothetical protein AURDEDRAFT_175569 [Auricularia subglabra TFB-10046 SS5]|uniref:Uncharacterized protein n=1 Tax=Auricularia subglabra (strain TFB-10046 / SS5) TaxID=717982 RepID=J0LEQ0_AURST|nr:hypothetical protein AURDEDRAFT_178192 [Auricularia subglabra TFB-10046 SS5]EJD35369.1 hypothetical protein AURDEDRAFT_175569 [Auricularia subglabra TFB-10046 SS5]